MQSVCPHAARPGPHAHHACVSRVHVAADEEDGGLDLRSFVLTRFSMTKLPAEAEVIQLAALPYNEGFIPPGIIGVQVAALDAGAPLLSQGRMLAAWAEASRYLAEIPTRDVCGISVLPLKQMLFHGMRVSTEAEELYAWLRLRRSLSEEELPTAVRFDTPRSKAGPPEAIGLLDFLNKQEGMRAQELRDIGDRWEAHCTARSWPSKARRLPVDARGLG